MGTRFARKVGKNLWRRKQQNLNESQDSDSNNSKNCRKQSSLSWNKSWKSLTITFLPNNSFQWYLERREWLQNAQADLHPVSWVAGKRAIACSFIHHPHPPVWAQTRMVQHVNSRWCLCSYARHLMIGCSILPPQRILILSRWILYHQASYSWNKPFWRGFPLINHLFGWHHVTSLYITRVLPISCSRIFLLLAYASSWSIPKCKKSEKNEENPTTSRAKSCRNSKSATSTTQELWRIILWWHTTCIYACVLSTNENFQLYQLWCVYEM